MTLRKTTILFVGLALVGLIAVLLFAQQVTMMNHFDQVEQQNVQENIRRAEAVLQVEYNDLEKTCKNWAVPDRLLVDSQDGETFRMPDLAQANLPALEIELAAFLDENGNPIAIRELDADTGPSPELLGALKVVSHSGSFSESGEAVRSGAVDLPRGLLLLAARPLSENGATLIVGRYLEVNDVSRLSSLLHISMQVRSLSDPNLPPSLQNARTELLSLPKDETWTAPLDEVTMGGYTLIPGWGGEPAGLLEVQLPRVVYRTGLMVKNFLAITVALSALIFGGTILYVLEGLVLSRVSRLNREVSRIGETGDLSARVTVRLHDELTNLSENINEMLASLEQSNNKRAELFEQVRAGQQSLQRLSRQLVNVQESERRRLALELHDEVGQMLTGLKLMLEGGRSLPEAEVRARCEGALGLANELIAQVRHMSLELRPPMLDDLGLLPALLWQIDRYTAQCGVQVRFQHREVQGRRFAAELETAAYRVVQEGLTNVARHAGVSEVDLQVWYYDGQLGILLEDFGNGFDLQTILAEAGSTGLLGIRERVSLLGGEVQIDSAPGRGTCLLVTLPDTAEREEEAA